MSAPEPSPALPAASVVDHKPSAIDAGANKAAASQESPVKTSVPAARSKTSRKRLVGSIVFAACLAIVLYAVVPWVLTALSTVSTDDAYVNSHVTFVAPRVAGQVVNVLVDDNYHVKKGALLVQLDQEPYAVQVAIKKAAVVSAEADLVAANAQVRALVATARANRFSLEHTMEGVESQVANLHAAVATLNSNQAKLQLSEANLKRGEGLSSSGGISKEDLDVRRQAVKVDRAAVDQALEQIYAIRVGLGLPAHPPEGKDLVDVPPKLEQNFSSVRQALGTLLASAAQFGYVPSTWDATPEQTIEAFYKQDPEHNLDRILSRLIPHAPAIQQAQAKVLQAQRDLDQAELNLRYCDVVSEIDGVVTRRNVNPGNNVAAGENLMAVRSVTEIWIDANFKETQLARLRIGQRARCEIDMYGKHKEFEGRITGFTMGTGQTLSLLPPQNATGNFVKIVQRLPVRIELTDYDPAKQPLFVGLSVVPYVYFKEPPKGPHAGDVLQPLAPLPIAPTDPKP
jgi:membrane fusion protein (multidrug efflux system)